MAKNNKKSAFEEMVKNIQSGNKSAGEEIHPTSFDPEAPIKKKEFVPDEKSSKKQKKKTKKDKNEDENTFLIIKEDPKDKSKYKAEVVVDETEQDGEIKVDKKDVVEVDFILVDDVKETVSEAAKQKPEIGTYRKFDKNSKHNREFIGDVRTNNENNKSTYRTFDKYSKHNREFIGDVRTNNEKPKSDETYRAFDKNSKHNKEFVGNINNNKPNSSSKANNMDNKSKEQSKATTTTKSSSSKKSNMSDIKNSTIKVKSDIEFAASELERKASNIWRRIRTTPLW